VFIQFGLNYDRRAVFLILNIKPASSGQFDFNFEITALRVSQHKPYPVIFGQLNLLNDMIC